jgi:TP901-1 family phage major tail protein
VAGNKIAGVDVLVSVMDAGVPKVIGGQSGATLNRSTNLIEVTSKDANGWAESVAGVRSWSVECEGFIVEDDQALDLLEQTWLNNGTVDVEIAMPSGKKYNGKALIEDFPVEFPQDDAVTFSITFTGTGELTITPSTP